MFSFLKLVPTSVWIGLAAALALMVGVWAVDRNGYSRGSETVRAEWAKEREVYMAALEKEKARQAQVVERVVVEYRDRVKIVKERGDEIVREVEKLVSADSCPLPGGFRVLHDAAASGSLPDDPAGVAAIAAPVEAPAAAETVAGNYAACLANAAQLTALQDLVKGLQ